MKRAEAVNGIPVPYGKSEAEVLALAGGHSPDCWAAIYALGFIDSEAARQFLMNQLSSDDWSRRRAAAEAVVCQPNGKAFAMKLVELLGDTHQSVVRTVCDSLGSIAHREANPLVLKLLSSNDAETRKSALRCLKAIWLPENLSTVFAVAQKDLELDVRHEASWTLRSNVTAANWKAHFELWCADELSRHRMWACELCGQFGNKEDRSLLTRFLRDVDGHVRKAATQAIANLA